MAAMAIPCQRPCQRQGHILALASNITAAQRRHLASYLTIGPSSLQPRTRKPSLNPRKRFTHHPRIVTPPSALIATTPRAILTVIPVVLHIRICDARLPGWGGREGRAGGV